MGNQGAIRGAYLVNYDVSKEAFIATAAAIAIFIDATRLPVYLYAQWAAIGSAWPVLLGTVASAYAGTYLGQRLVGRISQATFRWVVNAMIGLFGLVMIVQGTWVATGQVVTTLVAMLLAVVIGAQKVAAKVTASRQGAL